MQVEFQGRMIEVSSIDFLETKELWNEYRLVDGGVVRIKLIVIRILKADTEKDQYGQPIYILQSQNIVAPVE